MSYRSIIRALGATSIERKCMLLFGVSLLLLIAGAFLWVDQVAEGLVVKTTRSKARDLADLLIMQKHFERWDTREGFERFAESVSKDFIEREEYDFEVLAPTSTPPIMYLEPRPVDAGEEAILRELEARRQLQQRPARDAAPPKTPEATAASPLPANPEVGQAVRDEDFVFYERHLPEQDQYQYFAPVRWKSTCGNCHQTLAHSGALSAADAGAASLKQLPFLAVKVTLPYKETKTAMNQKRAVLALVTILTVSLGMLALYMIVSYIVVKPLRHLRDVSDDISRGQLETRAQIRTGDEFQELADSFNRMLRHLTDAQADLRNVNRELDAKVDELAQLNMRLYEMNRLKGDFLANMSHELRTPLNSIIGFSEVLQGIDALNDKQKRYAQNIQKSGRLLLEMINDILDLAKVEAGKMDVRPSELDIESLVSAQCDMVRSLSEEKNIDLTTQVEPHLPRLFQDQGKIQQILTNLLSNAIKFTPEGGRITVSARADSLGRLELTVADTGVGIAAEDREIIFEKFRQGAVVIGDDGLTRRYSGTGLGLSIVKELCRLLGGEISVESEVGKGSTFRVVLPWSRLESAERIAVA